MTEYSDWKARIQKNYEQQKENEDFCHFLVQKKRDIENLKKQVEIISIPLGCWRDQTEFLEDIMQVLGELGLSDGSIYGETYHKLFGWNPRGIVLHSPEYLPVREVLATAKASGGAVVFAHPTVYKSMPLVRQLAKEGIIDGIEVEHPRNSPEDRAECAALCEQYGLIHTGGTDFHGANHKVPHPVGTCTTADDQVARILELAHKRRGIDV
mgnify:CR=1 FL=1